jgi:hypothetical protein
MLLSGRNGFVVIVAIATACGGGGPRTDDESSGGATSAGFGGAKSGNRVPEYEIELQSGLGGPLGACKLNWCRFGTCHMMCLLVPDDRLSCDAAIEAYSEVPYQNFLDPDFLEGRTCADWSFGSTLCRDEFGVLYMPLRNTCNGGDEIADAAGACHYTFCTAGHDCVDGCTETNEAGCRERDLILLQAEGRESSSTSFSAGGTCPPRYPGSGGSSSTGGASSTGASTGSGGISSSTCSNCLSACRSLPGCCTGVGCICASAC